MNMNTDPTLQNHNLSPYPFDIPHVLEWTKNSRDSKATTLFLPLFPTLQIITPSSLVSMKNGYHKCKLWKFTETNAYAQPYTEATQ